MLPPAWKDFPVLLGAFANPRTTTGDDSGISVIEELSLDPAALNYSLPLIIFFFSFLEQVKVLCLFLRDRLCPLFSQDGCWDREKADSRFYYQRKHKVRHFAKVCVPGNARDNKTVLGLGVSAASTGPG